MGWTSKINFKISCHILPRGNDIFLYSKIGPELLTWVSVYYLYGYIYLPKQ